MSKNYKEEINKIVMNDDMKKRILQNVLAANEKKNSAEENIKVKTIIPKVKKYNNLKRNMQMVAACSAVFICLSVAKNYPMFFRHIPNDLEQKETTKSNEDENDDLKTSDNNEFVNNKDSKETSNNNHKEGQTLNQNNNIYKNGDSSEKEESNASLEIEKEEKNKDNLQSNSGAEILNNQTSQTNDSKATENSNISSKINPKEGINNNENPTNTESKTTDEEVKKNRVSESDTDNSVSSTSAVVEKAVIYNQEYKTLDEAEKSLNLKVNPLKTLPKDFKLESISVLSNKIIQVKYYDGNNDIIFRAGQDIDNISGDYNVYTIKNTAKVNGTNVSLEGNKSEEYNLAVWEKDGISYSISAKNSIDEKTILNMIFPQICVSN